MLHLATAFVERRAAKRVILGLRTRLLHRGLQRADIVVHDLSFTGFNGDTDAPVGEGELVSIGLPRIGLVRATIKWRRGSRIAGSFHHAVDIRACFRDPATGNESSA
jgi:hypothetical protein